MNLEELLDLILPIPDLNLEIYRTLLGRIEAAHELIREQEKGAAEFIEQAEELRLRGEVEEAREYECLSKEMFLYDAEKNKEIAADDSRELLEVEEKCRQKYGDDEWEAMKKDIKPIPYEEGCQIKGRHPIPTLVGRVH